MDYQAFRGDNLFRLVILMPVFRDWDIAALLCHKLDEQLEKLPGVQPRVLFIDDGSPEGLQGWHSIAPRSITRIEVLHLHRNVGHQRAIALGLCHVQERIDCDGVLVMDADGEDRPEDAAKLAKVFLQRPNSIIFAERRKRHEKTIFRIGYLLYRVLHRVLTGLPVRVGNFSVIPSACLQRLVYMSELWNHYAGAVFKSKLPYRCIPMDRGSRLAGHSHMDLVSLVVHGIAGIATFHDVVATRILLGNIIAIIALTVIITVVVGIRFGSTQAIPGWASYTVGLLLVLFVQFASMSFSLVFTLITNRSITTFLPAQHYHFFVEGTETLWSSSR